MFVLDNSGSVGATDFGVQLDFVTSFIGALDISVDATSTHFAVLTYGDYVYDGILLNQYTIKQDLLDAVDSLT